MELCDLTIKEAHEGLKEKRFSSRELTLSCLKRIDKFEDKLNAFITVTPELALKQADEADKIISDQPLWGIPIAIKDNFCTKGIRTTAASKVLDNFISPYDATAVKRLKDAGAIIIGKCNLDAWGHGSSGEHSAYGSTLNPWDVSRVPGGSSSGSGAAVASGFCLAATGTDTGGSIRQPAAYCSVVGLKPTYGRVSRYGIIAMASSTDSIGHLTKTIWDSAAILSVTAGSDPKDATTPDIPVPHYEKNLGKLKKGLKIGIPKEYFLEGLDKRMGDAIMEALKVLESRGCQLVDISLPHTEYAYPIYAIINTAEISSNLARYDGLRFGLERKNFADEAKRRIMLGTYALSAGYYEAYYLKAMKGRTLLIKDFEEAFRKVDVVVCPVWPFLQFKFGEREKDPLKMYLSDVYTVTANLTGHPALALPVGFVENLPVGMQLIGPQFSEDLLFKVGYAYEQAAEFYKRRPPLK